MKNEITFKYKSRTYSPKNLDKKLKQLGITLDDVELVQDEQTNKQIEKQQRVVNYYQTLYRYRQPNNYYATLLSNVKQLIYTFAGREYVYAGDEITPIYV